MMYILSISNRNSTTAIRKFVLEPKFDIFHGLLYSSIQYVYYMYAYSETFTLIIRCVLLLGYTVQSNAKIDFGILTQA